MIKIVIENKSKAMEELDQMYPEMDEPSEEVSKPATRADKYKSMCESEEEY